MGGGHRKSPHPHSRNFSFGGKALGHSHTLIQTQTVTTCSVPSWNFWKAELLFGNDKAITPPSCDRTLLPSACFQGSPLLIAVPLPPSPLPSGQSRSRRVQGSDPALGKWPGGCLEEAGWERQAGQGYKSREMWGLRAGRTGCMSEDRGRLFLSLAGVAGQTVVTFPRGPRREYMVH